MFRLSQGQLNLLATCPRKYQHTYLEQLGTPTSPEHQERLAWGSRFHLLMQQRELGLPIEALAQEDREMERCLKAFMEAAPDVFNPADDRQSIFRQAEHLRTLTFENYLLTVIYDLLVADAEAAKVFDWKTYPRPQSQRFLANNWQTRLYLYVLAETTDYRPDKLSMTYWFVKIENEGTPQSLLFSYNEVQHQQTQTDLTVLLNQLTDWLQRYQEKGEPFPQVNANAKECEFCQFSTRCQRVQEPVEPVTEGVPVSNWLQNLDQIEEISI